MPDPNTLNQLVNLFNAQSQTVAAYKLYHIFAKQLTVLEQKMDLILQRLPPVKKNDKEEIRENLD